MSWHYGETVQGEPPERQYRGTRIRACCTTSGCPGYSSPGQKCKYCGQIIVVDKGDKFKAKDKACAVAKPTHVQRMVAPNQGAAAASSSMAPPADQVMWLQNSLITRQNLEIQNHRQQLQRLNEQKEQVGQKPRDHSSKDDVADSFSPVKTEIKEEVESNP